MGRHEREKGIRAERAWAAFCREEGFSEVQRAGQVYPQRGSDVADVVGLPGIHQEIKHVEKLNVQKAIEQSQRDAKDEGRGYLPIVAHKRNYKEWLVTMRAADWFRIYRKALRK